MSARDDLARLIFITDNANAKDPAAEWEDAAARGPLGGREYAYAIADGLLTAGWTQEPRETLGHLVLASEHGDWTYRMGMADVMSLEDARQYREELLRRDERTPYAVVALLRLD